MSGGAEWYFSKHSRVDLNIKPKKECKKMKRKPEVELYYHEKSDTMMIKVKNKLYKYKGDFRDKDCDVLLQYFIPNVKFNKWHRAYVFHHDFIKIGEL